MSKLIARVTVRFLIAAAAALALTFPASADQQGKGKEAKVKLTDCPAAVQKTIKDNAVGGTIVEVEKETRKDGTVVYEAEIKKTDGKMVEIVVAPDGKLIPEADDDEDEENEDDDQHDDEDEDE